MTLLFETFTHSTAETAACGHELAERIDRENLPGFISLDGDLGVGKTEFTRGIGAYFSPGSAVKSPSFTLVNEYGKGRRKVYHFDVYRIKNDDDLYSTGYYDYPEDGVFVVEWAQLIPYAVPAKRIEVTIEKVGPEAPDTRRIRAVLVD